MATQSDPVF